MSNHTQLEKFKWILGERLTPETYLLIEQHLYEYTIVNETKKACRLKWEFNNKVLDIWIPKSCMIGEDYE